MFAAYVLFAIFLIVLLFVVIRGAAAFWRGYKANPVIESFDPEVELAR